MNLSLKNLWFQNPKADNVMINETAVRIRAAILILFSIFLSYTLYSAAFGSHWIVDTSTITDAGDEDFDGHMIYTAQMIRKTYDFTLQTWVLLYMLFDMLSGIFVKTSYLSPTIWLATILAKNKEPIWKPHKPKKLAWLIGATFISICLVFFNPTKFAYIVNGITHLKLLPTSGNYIPYQVAIALLLTCFSFMWMEMALGFCAGCSLHSLLVKIGIFKEECVECNDINSAQAQKTREEYYNK